MKKLMIFTFLLFVSCNQNEKANESNSMDSTIVDNSAISLIEYVFFFNEMIKDSDIIVIGKTIKGEIISQNRVVYQIYVEEQFKGNNKDTIDYHGGIGLKIGINYLFFFKKNQDEIFERWLKGNDKFEIEKKLIVPKDKIRSYDELFDLYISIPSMDIIMDNVDIPVYEDSYSTTNNKLYKIEDIKDYLRKCIEN